MLMLLLFIVVDVNFDVTVDVTVVVEVTSDYDTLLTSHRMPWTTR